MCSGTEVGVEVAAAAAAGRRASVRAAGLCGGTGQRPRCHGQSVQGLFKRCPGLASARSKTASQENDAARSLQVGVRGVQSVPFFNLRVF